MGAVIREQHKPATIGAGMPSRKKVLEKEATLPIRMRRSQRLQLDLAAAIRTLRGPHRVHSGPLLLELGLPAIEQIIASATPAELRHANEHLKAAGEPQPAGVQ